MYIIKKHKVYLSIYRIYLNFLQLSIVQLSSEHQVKNQTSSFKGYYVKVCISFW